MSDSHMGTEPISIHESEDSNKDFEPLARITTSGDQNEYIHLGGRKYLKSELEYAFGGTFTTGVGVRPHLKLGNASPMGLIAYAVTTMVLALINCGSRSVKNHSIMLGSGLFYGGILQILAGFWELLLENTFGGTVFATYGGFWISFSVMTMHGFNIEESYGSETEYNNATGLFFLIWAIISVALTLCLIRSTVPMFMLLFTVTLIMTFTSASSFAAAADKVTASEKLTQASGVVGVISGFVALYNAMGGLLNKENSYMKINPWFMPGAIRPDSKPRHKEV